MQEMPPRRSVQSLYASQEEPEASVQPPEPVPRRRSCRRPSRTQPTTPPVVEEPAAAMEHADAGVVLLHLRGRGDYRGRGDCRGIHFLWCVDGVLAWSREAPASTNT